MEPQRPYKPTRRLKPPTGRQDGLIPPPRHLARPAPTPTTNNGRLPNVHKARLVELHQRHLELGIKLNETAQQDSQMVDRLERLWKRLGDYLDREMPLF